MISQIRKKIDSLRCKKKYLINEYNMNVFYKYIIY